jgi:hypothetical protein
MKNSNITPIGTGIVETADLGAARELHVRLSRFNEGAEDRRTITAEDAKDLRELRAAASAFMSASSGSMHESYDSEHREARRAIIQAVTAYVDDVENGYVELPRAPKIRPTVLSDEQSDRSNLGSIRARIIEMDGGREQIAQAGEEIIRALADYISDRSETIRRFEEERKIEDGALATAKAEPIIRDVIAVIEQLLDACESKPDDPTPRHALNAAGQMLMPVVRISWIERKLPRNITSQQLVDAIHRRRGAKGRVA